MCQPASAPARGFGGGSGAQSQDGRHTAEGGGFLARRLGLPLASPQHSARRSCAARVVEVLRGAAARGGACARV